jgi:hypothetical protein
MIKAFDMLARKRNRRITAVSPQFSFFRITALDDGAFPGCYAVALTRHTARDRAT